MKCSWALWATALLAYGLASAEEISSDGLTREEGQSLVCIQQLSEWIGSPVALTTGLCVQRNYAGAWPASGLNNMSTRAESLLQQAWETCKTTGEGLRLVKQVRELLQGQILRLTQPHAALSRCQAKTVPEIDTQRCLVSAFGRSLFEEEQRALVTTVQHH
jgi:hypothetical protein